MEEEEWLKFKWTTLHMQYIVHSPTSKPFQSQKYILLYFFLSFPSYFLLDFYSNWKCTINVCLLLSSVFEFVHMERCYARKYFMAHTHTHTQTMYGFEHIVYNLSSRAKLNVVKRVTGGNNVSIRMPSTHTHMCVMTWKQN